MRTLSLRNDAPGKVADLIRSDGHSPVAACGASILAFRDLYFCYIVCICQPPRDSWHRADPFQPLFQTDPDRAQTNNDPRPRIGHLPYSRPETVLLSSPRLQLFQLATRSFPVPLFLVGLVLLVPAYVAKEEIVGERSDDGEEGQRGRGVGQQGEREVDEGISEVVGMTDDGPDSGTLEFVRIGRRGSFTLMGFELIVGEGFQSETRG
jgi:hypothetical protein